MTDVTLAALRQLLVDRYDDLKARLAHRLGSADLAADALQDTWLRLARTDVVGVVRSPDNYLFRTVLNVAEDQRRSRSRHLTELEIDNLLDVADDMPDPQHITQARSDLRAFEAILAELPTRRRAILLAARIDGLPLQEIADRLGVSLRMVSKELRFAHEHIVARRQDTKD